MRVLISGASGFLGRYLTPALQQSGHTPAALVRRAPHGDEVQWDPAQRLDPAKLASYDAVIHLAAKNIAGVWTKKFKQELLDSRVRGTRTLATAVAESFRRTGQPRVLISASGDRYYGDRSDEVLTEESSAGTGFLAKVAQEWEAATHPASEAGVRVVCLRIGVVLGRDGGALKPMLLPFRMGVGGRIGSGRQYMSWIGLDDVIGSIVFALENDILRGPVNIVGPSPVRNDTFVHALGAVLHRPTIFTLPEFVVRNLFGEMGQELLLTSVRALPAKLQAAGYDFRYKTLPDALAAVLAR